MTTAQYPTVSVELKNNHVIKIQDRVKCPYESLGIMRNKPKQMPSINNVVNHLLRFARYSERSGKVVAYLTINRDYAREGLTRQEAFDKLLDTIWNNPFTRMVTGMDYKTPGAE